MKSKNEFNDLKLFVLLVSAGVFWVTCSVGGVSRETSCTDGIDNNGNGLTDCEDPDCFDHPACKTDVREICDNGIDDNGNGLTDCDDPQCFNHVACQTVQEICDNGIDDNGNGYTDCEDAECADHPACRVLGEICDDGIDNTGNGLTDCEDPECAYHWSCRDEDYENCTDGIDNNGNGLTDCDDPYCFDHPYCLSGEGSLSCMGIDVCYRCCTPGDESCYFACEYAGTADAQTRMNAFYDCVAANCGTQCGSGSTEQECSSCLGLHCSAQIDACDWGYGGSTGCWTFMDCIADCSGSIPQGTGNADTCPENPTLHCFQDCFYSTGRNSVELYYAIFDCIDDYCDQHCADMGSAACQQCYEAYCSSQINACSNDG